MASTIECVNVAKVYQAFARERYAAILNEQAPKKIEDVVLGLETHFEKIGDLSQCDECGGWSPEKLPDGTAIEACPFRNDGKKFAAIEPARNPSGKVPTSEPVATLGTRIDVAELAAGKEGARQFAELFNTRLHAVVARLAVDMHDRGTELNAAQAAGLHARLGLSWEAYCENHFDLPKTTAFKCQRNARLFTRDDVAVLGSSKADELASCEADVGVKLLPIASECSVRDLRRRIIEAKQDDGTGGSTEERATANGKTHEPPAATIGLLAESGVVRMTRLGEVAGVGTIACIGGVVLQLALGRDAEGQLELHHRVLGARVERASTRSRPSAGRLPHISIGATLAVTARRSHLRALLRGVAWHRSDI